MSAEYIFEAGRADVPNAPNEPIDGYDRPALLHDVEYDLMAKAKLAALGISPALLSGEVTYATLSAALDESEHYGGPPEVLYDAMVQVRDPYAQHRLKLEARGVEINDSRITTKPIESFVDEQYGLEFER